MDNIKDNDEKYNTEEWKNKVEIVCRQTMYTEEEASLQLQTHEGNLEQVINAYIEVPEKTPDQNVVKGSVNQEIFKQIRTVMDDASKTYRESKGLEELEQRRQQSITEK